VPALIQVGQWPRGRGVGVSAGGGGALDIGLTRLADTRPAAVVVTQLHASLDGKSLWSLSFRLTPALVRNDGLYVYTLALMLGYAPSGAKP
jgi:hypothetical protein